MKDMWLHCDECHTELMVERLSPHMIGLTCPECGEVMLTKRDYAIARKTIWKSRLLNLVGRFIGLFAPVTVDHVLTKVKDGKVTRTRL